MDPEYIKDLVYVSPVTTISTILVVFLGIVYFLLKDRDLPPGPTGLPYFGYWPFFRDDLHIHLTEMTKKYGDVFSFTVTGQLYIHLGSIKLVKEAHVTRTDSFNERLSAYCVFTEIFGKGLVTTNGEQWKVLRKFFIQSFREYGLTSVKERLAGPIYDSVNATVDSLKATNGSPVNIILILNERSSAIFRRMMFNDDEITDEELNGMLECYQNVLTILARKNLLLIGEFARYFMFPRLEGYKFALESHRKMVAYLTTLVKRHEKTYSEDNIRDIIDSFIKERNERRKRGDPTAEYFTDEIIISSLVQLVGDGILSIAIFIAYFIHGLLEYPEEQEKIYQELQDVIGPDREITLEDRNKLPYMNAFIQEVMRTTDFFTLLPALTCTKETTLSGYRIPKGAITLMNLWSSHHDSKTFEEPDKFKPSRYLSEPGKQKAEAPIVFGVGKRACAGESFTMMQVFLFLTTIVRNFRLERPEGDVKKYFLDGQMDVCAHLRK